MDTALIAETLERAKRENGGVRTLGLRFYERLFEKYPAVKPLFHTPPEEQHKKLMASIGAIVASVTQPEKMVPYLHAMGIRHLSYQTQDAHYPAVKENLLAVLEEHLAIEGEWTDAMAGSTFRWPKRITYCNCCPRWKKSVIPAGNDWYLNRIRYSYCYQLMLLSPGTCWCRCTGFDRNLMTPIPWKS